MGASCADRRVENVVSGGAEVGNGCSAVVAYYAEEEDRPVHQTWVSLTL